MKIYTGIVVLVLLGSAALAQNPKYFFSLNSGVMVASPRATEVTATASTVHGVAFGRWKMGAGVGFDAYSEWQTMPLFAQLAFDFARWKNQALCIQFAYGWSHGWMQKPEWEPVTSQEGGKMVNPMVGYRFAAGDLSIQVGVGYKYQHVSRVYEYSWNQGGRTLVNSTRTEIDFDRFVLTLGVGLR